MAAVGVSAVSVASGVGPIVARRTCRQICSWPVELSILGAGTLPYGTFISLLHVGRAPPRKCSPEMTWETVATPSARGAMSRGSLARTSVSS